MSVPYRFTILIAIVLYNPVCFDIKLSLGDNNMSLCVNWLIADRLDQSDVDH